MFIWSIYGFYGVKGYAKSSLHVKVDKLSFYKVTYAKSSSVLYRSLAKRGKMFQFL